MKPIIGADVRDFLNTIARDDSILPSTNTLPSHILFPNKVAANLRRYAAIYRKHSLQPHIYYALKANKSLGLLKSARSQTEHAEISSAYELQRALAAGFTGPNLLASGPVKSEYYLRQCVEHGVVIAIDDPSELRLLADISRQVAKPVTVLLRVNHPGSRFGIPPRKIRTILTAKNSYDRQQITISGVSFHINNYSIADRQKLLAKLIELVGFARKHGHDSCDAISIGGGFTVNYVTNSTWQDWHKRWQEGQVETYNGRQFSSLYPYYSDTPKERFLDAILQGTSPGAAGSTLADVLRANNIRLIIEPGRSLLDQAGITVFTVNGLKKYVSDHPMIIVDGNINSMSEQWFGCDFLLDPLHLAQPATVAKQRTAGQYYIGGNLCLENDMLATRAIRLSRPPARGDRLVYVNTAGYQMDSNESEFACIPIPKKIVATKHTSTWRIISDEEA